MRLHLTLRELEVFQAIAQHENVLKASEVVMLTQSAASQALARLEQAVQQQLFDRHGRRLTLNEHGRLFLPQARALLDRAQALEKTFTTGALSVRIGTSTTIGNYLMPSCLAAFRSQHTGSKLNLMVGNTEAVVNAVANFEVDFGFIEGICHHPELNTTPWRDDDMVVFASNSQPYATRRLTAEQLAQLPWLLREEGSGTREVVEQMLRPYLQHFNVDMELGDSEAIKHTVAAGLGVSCLSRCVIEDLIIQNKVVVLDTTLPPLRRTLYCVMHQDKEITRGMQAFLASSMDETSP